MKKFLCTFLSLIIALSLVACGGDSGDAEVKESTDSSPATEETAEETTASGEITIEEAVLLDEAGVKITATGMDYEDFWGPAIKLLIENNSEKALTFQARNVSVNGYMVDSSMSEDVAAGKKANTTLSFMDSSLETCGINTIADMEFSFHVFDSAEWETYLDSALVQVKTSATDGFEYIYDDSGTPVYEGNGVKIVAKGVSENDSIFGPGLVLYLHNSGDVSVTVQVRDVSVNGFMIDPMFSCELGAGKHAIDAVTFFESDLEENGITEITDLELYFHIFDTEEWETIADTDIVALSF